MRMKKFVVAARVQGYSHKKYRKPCQDFYATRINQSSADRRKEHKNIQGLCDVYAVADGHGAERHALSRYGSERACNAFRCVVNKLLKKFDDLEVFREYLQQNQEDIAKAVEKRWKQDVERHYQKTNPFSCEEGLLRREEIHILYGTTLLGAVVTPVFTWFVQLGDGNIALTTQEETKLLFEDDGLFGGRTYSLCMQEASNRVKQCIIDTPKTPFLLALSTDGFYNSYENEEDYLETVEAYFTEIRKHGRKDTQKKLKDWLNSTSKYGSGDDISLVMGVYGV